MIEAASLELDPAAWCYEDFDADLGSEQIRALSLNSPTASDFASLASQYPRAAHLRLREVHEAGPDMDRLLDVLLNEERWRRSTIDVSFSVLVEPGALVRALARLAAHDGVRAVELRSVALASAVPQLRHLKGLRRLTLDSSKSASFLGELGPLHLDALTLQCRGTSDDDVRGLASLSSLRHLDLSLCPHATGVTLDSLGHLGIEGLALQHTAVSDAGLAAISTLATLKDLDLGDCVQVSAAGFETLIALRLERVRLAGTAITDLAPLEGCPRLEALDVSGSRVHDVRSLESLPTLRRLSLSHLPLSDEDLGALTWLTELQDLYVRRTRTRGEFLDWMPLGTLVRLDLSWTAAGDRAVERLRAALTLVEVGLQGTAVTDAGVAVLASLPELAEVDVRLTQVTRAGLDALAARDCTVLEDVPRRLDELGRVRWDIVEHAYGPAIDVPDALRRLRSSDATERNHGWRLLYDAVLHQGSRYPATSAVLPYLRELLADPTTPAPSECVRFIVCAALGESHRDPSRELADPELISSLEDYDAYTAAEAAVPELLAGVADGEEDLRCASAWGLSWFVRHVARTAPALLRQLEAGPVGGRVHHHVVLALGYLARLAPGSFDLGHLRSLLRSELPWVRRTAAIGIVTGHPVVSPAGSAPLLVEILARDSAQDPGPSVWFADGDLASLASDALEAAWETAHDEAYPALLDALRRASGEPALKLTRFALERVLQKRVLQERGAPNIVPSPTRAVDEARVLGTLAANEGLWRTSETEELVTLLRRWKLPTTLGAMATRATHQAPDRAP